MPVSKAMAKACCLLSLKIYSARTWIGEMQKTYSSWLVEMLDAKLDILLFPLVIYFLYTCYLNSLAALWVRISSIVLFHPKNQSSFIQILCLSIRPRKTIQTHTVLIPYQLFAQQHVEIRLMHVSEILTHKITGQCNKSKTNQV